MLKRLLVALALVLAVVAGGAGAAHADDLLVKKVDTSKFPQVTVSAQLNGAPADLSKVVLRENGVLINKFDAVPLGRTNTPVGVVLVIDTSGSMNQNGKLDAAKAAARQFVNSKQPNDQIALVSFNSQPRVLVNFTSDANALLNGINGLAATGETALWDAVHTGVGLYGDHPNLEPNLVIISDGKDTVSTGNFNQAKSAAQGAHATVYAVGLTGGDFDGAALQDLTSSTQGQYAQTADPAQLTTLFSQVQRSLQNQYQVTYTSTAQGGTLDISLAFGAAQATASVNAGGVTQGPSTQPQTVDPSSGVLGFLGGSLGKWMGVLLGLVAAGLLAYGLILLFARERSTLETALQPYTEGGGGDAGGDDYYEDNADRGVFSDSAIMQRALDLTTRIAEDRGVLAKAENMMEQADLPLRAAEALFFYVAGVAVLTLLIAVLSRSIFATLATLILTLLLPPGVLQFLAGQRKRKFQAQLPDMLQLIAGSLRAGYSLLQGVEAVAQEVSEPMGGELRRVLAEARLGRTLEESLDDMAERLASRDFAWAVMAIRIQREVGGNLAELLSTVAETMIARERLRREVRALTAEGRISAIIVGLLPIGLGIVMYSMNREYMNVLLHDGFGQTLLIGAILMAGVGFWWMKKTIEIDI
ncbi:MAG: VWA domain-containing protein [Acidimicrobiia bacterium]|nr:VWA domain-containing protein [Acidimicrobiia bacterium]